MTTTCATSATSERDPVSETLATIDALITRGVTLAADIATLRARLADLAEERKLREATCLLATDGRNEAERQARARVTLAADGDVRRLAETERETRLALARLEAQHWAARQRLAVCLSLLRLATERDGAADAGLEAMP